MHCCLKQQIFLPLVTIQRMKNCRAKLNSTGSFILKGLAAWPQHQQLSPEAAAAQRSRSLRDDTKIEPRGFLLLFPTPKPNEWSHSASEVRRKHQLFLTFESHTPANHILEKILLDFVTPKGVSVVLTSKASKRPEKQEIAVFSKKTV